MSDAPINFYDVMPKKFLKKTHNPHYDKHKIKLPLIMIVAGATGAMKTNTVLNVLYNMPDTFSKVVVITRNRDEPLYNFLKDAMPKVEIHEGLQHLPDLDKEFDKKENSLVIFDDLVLEKNQKRIEEYSIRCRKMGVSMMYLTQSWYKTPDTIRKNFNYLILKKIPKMDELKRILRDYSLGVDIDTLIALYKHAIEGENDKDKTNYFMIDMEADENEKFRKNLKPITYKAE
jgi:hypothetical protein